MANVNSKFFDSIRISKKQEAPSRENNCQWEGCEIPAVHKAPKGRGMEGQYYNSVSYTHLTLPTSDLV